MTKKNIFKTLALLPAIVVITVVFGGCKEEFPVIIGPDGQPVTDPGRVNIVAPTLPVGLGINLTGDVENHHYSVQPNTAFNISAGNYLAIGYTNGDELGETDGSIINIPASADGQLTQPSFSASVTPFTVVADRNHEIPMGEFLPMTRQLAIPFKVDDVETDRIKSISLRINYAAAAVDVSKGFGHATTPISTGGTRQSADNFYIVSPGTFTVPPQLSSLAHGLIMFNLPAAPVAANGYMSAVISIEIEEYGTFESPINIPGITDAFNAGPATSPFFAYIIALNLTPGGINSDIIPWEKEPGIEIPGN